MFERIFKNAFFDETVTDTVLDTEFFLNYKINLSNCHSDKDKSELLYLQFKDLYTQLNENTVPHKASSTYWNTGVNGIKTLVFCPSKIDAVKIKEEQRESLTIMHENIGKDVEVVMDFSDLTWKQVSLLLKYSSQDSLKNGVRLWKTIPHKIKSIFIITPSFSGWTQLFSIAKFWMTDKIKSRIVVCDSWNVFYKLKK